MKVIDLQGEIWKDIPGYEGIYAVSNIGRVKTLPHTTLCTNLGKTYHKTLREKIKKSDKYGRVLLRVNYRSKSLNIKVLVANLFGDSNEPCRLTMTTQQDLEKILEDAWKKGIKFLGNNHSSYNNRKYFDEEVFQKEAAKAILLLLEEKENEAWKAGYDNGAEGATNLLNDLHSMEIAELKAENERLKSPFWMTQVSHKIYMEGLKEPGEMNYLEQTNLFVEWMKQAQLNSAEPLPEQ